MSHQNNIELMLKKKIKEFGMSTLKLCPKKNDETKRQKN